MTDDISDKRRRSKKKRSSLSTWKKKFNIKKRFTSKLPLHGRHIRSLMSGWTLGDVRSVLTQYEVTGMLKQLSIMADKSQVLCPSAQQDILDLYKKSSCCDVRIMLTEQDASRSIPVPQPGYLAHRSLLSHRCPYFRKLIKSELGDAKKTKKNTCNEEGLPVLFIRGMQEETFRELLKGCYKSTPSDLVCQPQKLQPLPTTGEASHPLRRTIMECDHPVVTRRHIVRRKHKHRFSMDERILSNVSIPAPPSRMQPTRSSKFPHGEGSLALSLQQHAQSLRMNDSPVKSDNFIPNSLEEDLLTMYREAESGSGDLRIAFTNDSSSTFTSWVTPHSRRRDFSSHYQAWISQYESSNFYSSSSIRDWQDPVFCHRVILAARSPYFRRLLQRQMSAESCEDLLLTPMTLQIEGSVISPRYMHALLYTMYTDKVDIQKVYERSGQRGIQLGSSPFHLRDAMMLHHIGCFIEFPRLIQGCEEIIVENLDQNNLLQVIHWTSLPHGSQWVKRQVNCYIREKFTELLGSGVLFELKATQLIEILESDFVNASELDVLKCALRWGEHELLRRIEEREPNILTHTAHSISRSKTASARRRELIACRIDELHDCTAPVLACVRMQHLLPPNHELFLGAVKRGVISRPPAHLLENDREGNGTQWIKEKSGPNFTPPRLFQLYIDETTNILEERYSQDNDCVSLRSVHTLTRDQNWYTVGHRMSLSATRVIPDALYMVGRARAHSQLRHHQPDSLPDPPIKFINNCYPVPDASTLREMFSREREVRSTQAVAKVLRACIDCCHGNNDIYGGGAFSAGLGIRRNVLPDEQEDAEYCNRCTAIRLVRLLVAREFDQPECAADLLRRPELYYSLAELQAAMACEGYRTTSAHRSNNFKGLSAANGRAVRNSGAEAGSAAKKLLHFQHRIETRERRARKHTQIGASPLNIPNSGGESNREAARDTNPRCGVDNGAFLFDSQHDFRRELLSTSSSEEENPPRTRRKRRSVSRKGSSSTTVSYQSIPDVAASANSSLQRRKSNAATQAVVPGFRELASRNPENFASFSKHPGASVAKFTRRPSFDRAFPSSSSSSCEENTSEDDSDVIGRRKLDHLSTYDKREFFLSTHPTLGHLPETDSSEPAGPSESRRSKAFAPDHADNSRFHNISRLVESQLNFIDDADDVSPDDRRVDLGVRDSNLPNSVEAAGSSAINSHPNMPELVKDGTLPKQDGDNMANNISFEKPDIYPEGGEIFVDSEEQCGKYFFRTIVRDSRKTTGGETSSFHVTQPRTTSFSFALNRNSENPPASSKTTGSTEREPDEDQVEDL